MQPWQSDLDHINWLHNVGINSFSGHKILDLGCGSGYLCETAMREGASSAFGIDVSIPKNSKSSQEQYNWQFLNLNLDGANWEQQLPKADKFSLILAFDIIEHLSSPFGFLDACRKIISENGQIVLTTPNLISWERYAKPSNWSGVNDPQHKTLFSRYSLEFLLNRAGYSTVNTKAPMRILSFLGAMQPNLGGQILCVARP